MRPLQPVEFIAYLAKCEPIYREEESAYINWYSKTPTGSKFLNTEKFEILYKNPKKKSTVFR